MASIRRCCIRKGPEGSCGNAVEDWMDYAVCLSHAAKVAASMRSGMAHVIGVERKEDDRQGHVYYLRNGGRVKIGYSINVRGRVDNLSHSFEDVLAVEPGTMDTERARHRMFADTRARSDREWFDLTDDLLRHIHLVRKAYPDHWPNSRALDNVSSKALQ